MTSDHGEALGEHGEAVHGFFLYDATIRVPLLLRGPGIVPGTRISTTIQSIDLYPTVLNLAGVPIPSSAHIAGRSLVPALRGSAIEDAPAFAESLTPRIHYGWSDLRSVREGRWKFILAPRPELYDLERDPGELRNLADAEPARARALRAGLDRHLADDAPGRAPAQKTATRDVPAELVQKLGALGYTSGSAPDVGSAGADPKDKIDEYRVLNALLHEGLEQLRDRKYAAAAARFGDLSARGIDSFESHYYYGQALVGLGRWRDGAREFERAIPRLPGFAASYLMLADCRVATQDRNGAIEALRLGVRAVPSDARLHRRLGELYRDSGDLRQSVAAFREGIALDPAEASQWNSVGMILGATEDPGAAEQAFREAIQRDPKEARYTYNLGLTLQRAHKPDEAAAYFRKTLELNPQFGAARDRLKEIEKK